MSSECDKCGKHSLECICPKYTPGPNDKFYYQGRFFSESQEFWKYVSEFSSRQTTVEDFDRLFDTLKKDVWMDLHVRKAEISNSELSDVLQETFVFIMKRIWN